jgi:hypothetical protein
MRFSSSLKTTSYELILANRKIESIAQKEKHPLGAFFMPDLFLQRNK